MNQLESILEFLPNCRLHLWTDATDEIDAHDIKRFIKAVVEQFDLRFVVSTYYYQECQHWTIRFKWRGSSMVHGVEHLIRVEDLERFRMGELPYFVVAEICDRIRRLSTPDDNQNWVIVRYREEHFAKIHQAGKRSINLILYEVTQEGDLTTNHTTVTIRARIPSDAIRRHDSVEIGGMLLQGELLGWVEDGQQGWFLFSPNTQQVNTSRSWADEPRITFTTRPRINRLASFERISQMIEQGQIEIPRSGYFDQFLMDYPDRPERVRLEIPRQYQFTEPSGESFQLLEGRFEIAREAVLLPRINAINVIGDTTCQYNARSRMIRCAVNPCGPCEGCQHYEKI
jgi:hypothetical protein